MFLRVVGIRSSLLLPNYSTLRVTFPFMVKRVVTTCVFFFALTPLLRARRLHDASVFQMHQLPRMDKGSKGNFTTQSSLRANTSELSLMRCVSRAHSGVVSSAGSYAWPLFMELCPGCHIHSTDNPAYVSRTLPLPRQFFFCLARYLSFSDRLDDGFFYGNVEHGSGRALATGPRESNLGMMRAATQRSQRTSDASVVTFADLPLATSAAGRSQASVCVHKWLPCMCERESRCVLLIT